MSYAHNRSLKERLFIYPIGHITAAVISYIKDKDSEQLIVIDAYVETVLLKKIILYNIFNMLGSEFGIHVTSIEDYNNGNGKMVHKLVCGSSGVIDKQIYRYCRDIASTLTEHDTSIYVDILLIGNNLHIYTF